MSQRAPGYQFQYQVPPTSEAVSKTTVVKPSCRRRCSRYSPENPAPTTTTSTSEDATSAPSSSATVRPHFCLHKENRERLPLSAVCHSATAVSMERIVVSPEPHPTVLLRRRGQSHLAYSDAGFSRDRRRLGTSGRVAEARRSRSMEPPSSGRPRR